MSEERAFDDRVFGNRVFGDIATRLLFENSRVRVWEMILEPGQRSALHRHEHDYLMVQLAGDEISAEFEVDSEDGFGGATMPDRTITAPVSPGMVVWAEAGGIETAVNTGSETFRELVVELKD